MNNNNTGIPVKVCRKNVPNVIYPHEHLPMMGLAIYQVQ